MAVANRQIDRNNHKNRAKAFKTKLTNDRKTSLGNIAKDIDSLVKSELNQTKQIFEEHVKFLNEELDKCFNDENFSLDTPTLIDDTDDEDYFDQI